ncbi:MAG TPA: CRISPR-associated protein Csx16 [Accumulibacter sp.]|nr:CRISPR-associated protein Csx16 [Accumulibacter sp.]
MVDSLDPERVLPGDAVIGTLPIHLAARQTVTRFLVDSLAGHPGYCRAEWRGQFGIA